MNLGQQFILVLNLDLYFSAFISEKRHVVLNFNCFPEHAGQRDRYDRDRDREPYFDRQSNVMADHRDFKRDRETHRDRDRDRGVIDYDRDRFDRERRPRDDRYAKISLLGVQITIYLSSAKVSVVKGNLVNDVFFLCMCVYNLEREEY